MRKSIELFHKRVILRKRECLLLFLFFQQVNRQQKSGEYIHLLYTFSACCLILQSIINRNKSL
ncbi:hypothetical protein E5349_12760 [Enterococcus faecalis]|nr:hypothetical protein E5349_12760 [Enterococcus faecalis]